MGDIFKEQLVKVAIKPKDKALKVLLISAIVAEGVLILASSIFIVIGLAALIVGEIYLLSCINKEYEYILTNNELDIDVIYNRQRRKKVTTIDLKNISIMAGINNATYSGELSNFQKILDLSDGNNTSHTYAIIYPINGEITKVLITPNEEMVQLIYRQAPNKVRKNIG
ncbi:hypothetical protein AN639_01520 [Candidatus Epulonipiscium fishelsonii]|uniref:Uncharacterized protein n=1 Tax=Candidatus Epulonipiscium fishelsonii TaxID=77094 RepID=A0ACC8XBE0_9FIRM|nr:hypothetical protein AN639_01520 [Epulopiscium sp. SCG-B05WGA-EpuloA1]ONI39717.1 hypothetical protein AN396_07560 [Epulopiscium sp. SCG-B11WGA-EpuloA1]